MGNNIYQFCNCIESHLETDQANQPNQGHQTLQEHGSDSKNKTIGNLGNQCEKKDKRMTSATIPNIIVVPHCSSKPSLLTILLRNANDNNAKRTSKSVVVSTTERNVDQSSHQSQLAKHHITYSNGDEYNGELKGEKRNGKGHLIYSNGIEYEGDFIDDLYHGDGILINKYIKFKGQFYQGMKTGFGIEKDEALQSKYEGEWSNNMKHGLGKETMSDGSVFTGHFENGMKHGQGRLTLLTGAEFQGEFVQDKIEGKGIFKWSDEKIYNGQWSNNSLDGLGILIQGNKRFAGYFSNGMRNGVGLNYFFNLNCLVLGVWKNEQLNGIALFLSETEGHRKEIWVMKSNKKQMVIEDASELKANEGYYKEYSDIVAFYYFVKERAELRDERMKMDNLI